MKLQKSGLFLTIHRFTLFLNNIFLNIFQVNAESLMEMIDSLSVEELNKVKVCCVRFLSVIVL